MKPILSTRMQKLINTPLVLFILPQLAFANAVGTDHQNFNAITSGLDFVTVHSSETLNPAVMNFGLFVNYGVNTLPFLEKDDKRKAYTDAIWGADLNMGIGILPNWDAGISFPQVLSQDINSDAFRGEFKQNGNSEIRLNTKVRLWGKASYGVGVVGSVNINRIENNPYTGKGAGPTKNLELVADTTIDRVAMAINLGYRSREPGTKLDEFPIEPLRDQFIASAAANYLLPKTTTKLIAEIFGSQPVQKVANLPSRKITSAEALVGLKHAVNNNIALHFGGGTELMHGVASPDWRLYAGINATLGPDSDPKPKRFVKRKRSRPKDVAAPPITIESYEEAEDIFSGPVTAMEETIVIHNILFAFDSDWRVVRGAKETLEKLSKYLMREPIFTRLVIEGHTDWEGTDEYNMDLSRRRGERIKEYLVKVHNLDAGKIFIESHGESQPVADNGNYQGRQLNRRVVFQITRY